MAQRDTGNKGPSQSGGGNVGGRPQQGQAGNVGTEQGQQQGDRGRRDIDEMETGGTKGLGKDTNRSPGQQSPGRGMGTQQGGNMGGGQSGTQDRNP